MTTTLDNPDTDTAEAPAQIAELELVITDTNDLSVPDTAMRDIALVLRPIADSIPAAQAYASTLKVTNQSEAVAAAMRRDEMIAAAKTAKESIDGFQDGIINKLHKLHRRWTAFRGLFDPLEAAAKQVKQAIIAWQQAEEEKAAAEQRRLQAEADERARRERDRLEKEAARLKTPELREARLEAAAAVIAPVLRVAAPVATVGTQKRWYVLQVDRAAFLAAAAADPNLQGYITIDETKLARSKSANSALTVPGIVFERRTI